MNLFNTGDTQMGNEMTSWGQAIGHAKSSFNTIAEDTGMAWERERSFAMQAITKNDLLQKCPAQSIRDALINVASIGLSLNPAQKLAYIIPRNGVAVLDVSYQGLLELATRSGAIKYVTVGIVYEDDVFNWYGHNAIPQHEVTDIFTKQRGKLKGAFCVAHLTEGGVLVSFMDEEDIHKVRAASSSYKNPKARPYSPWTTWYEQMVKKTMIKRASKEWPKSRQLNEAIHVLNAHEGIDFEQQEEKVINIDSEQLANINKLIQESGVKESRIFTAFQIDRMEILPADQYEDCVSRLNDAIKLKAEKEAKAEEDKKAAKKAEKKNAKPK